eukprot:gene13111-9389_t
MGCTQSTSHTREPVESVSSPKSSRRSMNPLTELEIQSRIEASKSVQTLEIDGVKMRYAFMSQRGYYPEALDKDNQDAYSLIPQFGADKESQAFFGVYDGHDGHYCARFARDNLPRTIADKFAKIPSGSYNSKSIKQALAVAHNSTNDAMHAEPSFDDSLSGTTSISVLLRGRTMYISNVGDSRAIIVSKTDDDRLVAKPLSSDQTPYRKDERERCKKYGARIMSMDQIEGMEPIHENWGDLNLGETIDEGGDPPRIWSPKGDYPGTAFTRSLGDCVAEECGVVAEPEILEREILPHDKFIIIASDGVFEFLTNQMAADMVARYTDPLEACKAIVNASYNMWLQYEVRTDDITAIIIYIDDVGRHSTTFNSSSSFFATSEEKAMVSPSGKRIPLSQSSQALNTVATGSAPPLSLEIPSGPGSRRPTLQGGNSPVNQSNPLVGISQKAVGVAVDDVVLEARPVRRTMSREKRKHMISMMSAGHEDENEETKIAEAELTEEDMRRLMTTKTETEEQVISSAMRSNFLFHHLNAAQRTAVIGSGVDQHPGFGELSLMYGKPRAASVIALTDGKLWALDRRIFKRVVLRPKDFRKDILKVLKKVELFKALNLNQLQRLVDLMNEAHYSAGERIIRQGDLGDTFYVIVKGFCECSIDTIDAATGAVKESKNIMQASAQRCIEAAKLLQQYRLSTTTSSSGGSSTTLIHALVPPPISLIRQPNALHFVFETGVVSDLSSFIRTHSEYLSELRGEAVFDPQSGEVQHRGDYITYLFACIVTALESLHDLGIVYRAVQPEALYLDVFGRVVFVDYRFARLGLYPGGSTKAFTICGASDYLSPEQIAQTGHSYPVDLWGMGVLLYELTVGSHPFSSSTEVATYAKISTFGTKSNPALKFPDHFPADTKSLINQLLLLVPTPEARIGSGQNGFAQLKKHAFFQGFNQWESLTSADPTTFQPTTTTTNNGSSSPTFVIGESVRSSNKSAGFSSTKNNASQYQFPASVLSPLRDLVMDERAEIIEDGMDAQLLTSFASPFEGNVDWLKSLEI